MSGDRLADFVEWRANPRSKLCCDCGSGKPTLSQIVTRDHRKIDCCDACKRRVWNEETAWVWSEG